MLALPISDQKGISRTYSEPGETFKMERFIRKGSVLDVWLWIW